MVLLQKSLLYLLSGQFFEFFKSDPYDYPFALRIFDVFPSAFFEERQSDVLFAQPTDDVSTGLFEDTRM